MFLLCIFPKGNNQIDSVWGLSLMLYTSPAPQNNNNNNTTSRLYDYDVCAQFKRHKSYQLFCSNRKKQDFVVSFSSFLSFFLRCFPHRSAFFLLESIRKLHLQKGAFSLLTAAVALVATCEKPRQSVIALRIGPRYRQLGDDSRTVHIVFLYSTVCLSFQIFKPSRYLQVF